MNSVPVLFEHYPNLKGRIPWIPLGHFPTRVHRLAHMGHDNLWIKRDNESSPLYGGNKVRKLEFALADAIERGKKLVVTMGGIGTNHGLATAIFCRELGLRCRLLLFDQPVTSYVKQNLLLFHRYGAELKYYRTMLGTGAMFDTMERLVRPNAYFLYAGGSSPHGTIGFVNAMFELRRQIDAGEMPMPKYIFCPLGSNGTMAGISLGTMLAGIAATVIGVRVTVDALGPIQIATEGTVRSLMKATHKLLKKNDPSIPDIAIPRQRLIDTYVGEGYGCATGSCLDAMDVFKDREKIALEPTYTAKTVAALLDFIQDPVHKNEPVLYWHTYNSVDLSSQAAAVDYHELPENLHWVFEK